MDPQAYVEKKPLPDKPPRDKLGTWQLSLRAFFVLTVLAAVTFSAIRAGLLDWLSGLIARGYGDELVMWLVAFAIIAGSTYWVEGRGRP